MCAEAEHQVTTDWKDDWYQDFHEKCLSTSNINELIGTGMKLPGDMLSTCLRNKDREKIYFNLNHFFLLHIPEIYREVSVFSLFRATYHGGRGFRNVSPISSNVAIKIQSTRVFVVFSLFTPHLHVLYTPWQFYTTWSTTTCRHGIGFDFLSHTSHFHFHLGEIDNQQSKIPFFHMEYELHGVYMYAGKIRRDAFM